jgi:hypothetical protein
MNTANPNGAAGDGMLALTPPQASPATTSREGRGVGYPG